ncbi:MAG TPA: hypothetical protein VGV85_01900 [Longimicrobiaceae bacterium]|nr:hypothetical protein [Longimicrobiaceae bacterium]
MRLRALALPLLVLAALPGAALAQDRTDPPKEIRVTSATPGQDVYFRVQMESSVEAAGGTLELVGASAISKQGEDVQVRTPATLRIISEGPFRVTLASAPGEGRIQVVRIGGDREVTASGDLLTLAREERGGGVQLLRAKEIHVRMLEKPASR